jgi:hypothetical protein
MDNHYATKKDIEALKVDNAAEHKEIMELLEPIIDRDERVDWLAKKIVRILKFLLLVLSILVATLTLIKQGGLWR